MVRCDDWLWNLLSGSVLHRSRTLSVCLSIHLSVGLSVGLPTHPSIHPYIHPPICHRLIHCVLSALPVTGGVRRARILFSSRLIGFVCTWKWMLQNKTQQQRTAECHLRFQPPWYPTHQPGLPSEPTIQISGYSTTQSYCTTTNDCYTAQHNTTTGHRHDIPPNMSTQPNSNNLSCDDTLSTSMTD